MTRFFQSMATRSCSASIKNLRNLFLPESAGPDWMETLEGLRIFAGYAYSASVTSMKKIPDTLTNSYSLVYRKTATVDVGTASASESETVRL